MGSLLQTKLPAASWGQTKQGKAAPEPGKAACSLALGFCCPGCVPARIRATRPCRQSSQHTEATQVLPRPTTARPASALQAPTRLSLAAPIAKGLVGGSKASPKGCQFSLQPPRAHLRGALDEAPPTVTSCAVLTVWREVQPLAKQSEASPGSSVRPQLLTSSPAQPCSPSHRPHSSSRENGQKETFLLTTAPRQGSLNEGREEKGETPPYLQV